MPVRMAALIVTFIIITTVMIIMTIVTTITITIITSNTTNIRGSSSSSSSHTITIIITIIMIIERARHGFTPAKVAAWPYIRLYWSPDGLPQAKTKYEIMCITEVNDVIYYEAIAKTSKCITTQKARYKQNINIIYIYIYIHIHT